MPRLRPHATPLILMLLLVALPGCGLLGAAAGTAVSVVKGAVGSVVEAPAEDTEDQPVTVANTPQASG
ncbi:MAG: hypothetical protein AAF213_04320 [Pseudomonadota bacterium]